MKQTKLLLLGLIMLSSLFFSACDNEKENEEKRENVEVNHTYNNQLLTVLIVNNNEEKVKVEIYVRYNSGILDSPIEYIEDEVSVEAHGRIQKEYPLTGDIPNCLELRYKVY